MTGIYDYGVIPKDYNNRPVDVARLVTDTNGNTVLVGADGVSIPTMLKNKTVWYRLRHKSGTTLVDAMGNGPDIPVVAINGTPNLWTTAKMATPPNDGTGKSSTYARVIGNAYLESLFAVESLISSQGLLFFAADIYPQTATPDKTQTIFMMGAGNGNEAAQAITMSQHITSGVGRTRICDNWNGVDDQVLSMTETAQLSIGGGAGATRSALCGYIDALNNTVGISLNGGAFTTAACDFAAGHWSDASMNSFGFCMFALNPESDPPVQFMGGSAGTLGTKTSGLFITRFDTHPGLDFIAQLATEFYDTVGVFPEILKTGKY